MNISNFVKNSFLYFFVFLLSSCGGGGGSTNSNSGSQSSTLISNLELATTSQLTSSVNLGTNTIKLNWLDKMPSGSVYSIQSQNTDGTYSQVSSQAATGSGSQLSWEQPITVSGNYQVIANVAGQSFALNSPSGATIVPVTIPNAPPDISISPSSSNVSGIATLSLNNNFAYSKVSWFVDTNLIGIGTGVGNPFDWNSSVITNGAHLIIAVINLSSDSTLYVRKQINVINSNLALSISPSGTTGNIAINVSASSNFPIQSISEVMDSGTVNVLTAPNYCVSCGGINNTYQFMVNSIAAGSGNHSVTVTATDSSGSTITKTINLPIFNPPTLTLSNPVDGIFINQSGTLTLNGSMSTDRSGGLSVTAFLGSLPIPITKSSSGTSFTGSLSLNGFNAGPYTVTINAVDSANVTTTIQESVIVTSSINTTYSPIFSMGTAGSLVTIDSSNPNLILYVANDGTYRTKNLITSTEVILTGASAIPFRYNWAMDGGYVFMEGGWVGSTSSGYTDCPSDRIFMWTPSGSRVNLYNSNPNRGNYEQYPKAHNG